MAATDKPGQTPEEQRRRAKAKIRTIRIWFWVVMALFCRPFLFVAMRLEQTQSQRRLSVVHQNVPFPKNRKRIKRARLGRPISASD